MSTSAASFSFEPHIKLMMKDALNICSTSIYLSQASMVEDQVKVCYIPEKNGPAKGQGIVQCRAKVKITQGTLRLYPLGGSTLHLQDKAGRTYTEKKFRLKSCYM